ncbi:T cell activation RhoGTPase activating protein a isoform X2 [Paramisgurnus dabryanus]
MKVLSGHGVCKSLTLNSMDLISMQAPVVHAGLPHSQQPSLTHTSHTENMNRKRWRSVFRRVQKKNMDSAHACVHPKQPLFGKALSDVCEKDGSLPKPIMDVLTLLLKKGLYTEGVFRTAGNAKTLKEIKAQLNDGMKVDLKGHRVVVLADLLKDFLRHLPGSLLIVEQYKSWMNAMEKEDMDQKCAEIQMVINKLPDPNVQLLKHLVVLLYRISENSDTNKMDSSNLAVCISPNLLQTDNLEEMTEVRTLTKFLIDNCCRIFGEDALNLYGDSDEDELSDNQDSFSSNHHDSAYDSNDTDVDGYKGSCSDMESIKPVVEGEAQEHSSAVEPWTTKLLTRRRSEPTIMFNKGVRQNLPLTRSHTEMDFQDKLVTKQISDDCILFQSGNSLEKSYGLAPKCRVRQTSKDCSSSSLESCFSSASESSIHNSPPIPSLSNQRRLLQRKHSFPTRQSTLAQNRLEMPKRRTQSMKGAHIRSRTVFGRSGSTKRAIERTLRHSQTLPEVLNPQPEPSASSNTRCLSSEEVFQQVDSRIPSNPPSYQQAIQDNSHAVLSNRGSLTVQDARCLSKKAHSSSTSTSNETLDSSCGDEHYDTHNRDIKDTCCETMSEVSSGLRPRSTSEPMYETSLPEWCNQDDLRETYI